MAAELPNWPEEHIEDEDWLYRRLPSIFLKPNGLVSNKLFMRNVEGNPNKKEPDPDVSVDWARYATPEQALALAERPMHGIGGPQAKLPRELGLTVTHTPNRERGNRAHASIRGNGGPRGKERCLRLAEAFAKNILIWPSA